VSVPARQAGTLSETGHRPWPVPERPWIQGQTWDQLLFAHWSVEPETLRSHVPEELPLDVFDGSAWIGITPFRISGFRLRGMLPLPVISSFLEVNARTYVSVDGKPGISFFSLDTESPLAAAAARWAYSLPYYVAEQEAHRRGPWLDFSSRRVGAAGRESALELAYRPVGDPRPPAPGSVEHFLTERYCLYTVDRDGDVAQADIHHKPWPLQEAEAEWRENTLAPDGVELTGEPLLHYSERQDVVLWALEKVG
jgi:uncharacterized protein YqjF (DUF2071 family)